MTEAPPTLPTTSAVEPEVRYCANHPKIETGLRCATCEKPICAKCAVRTPTGYRCRECISGQQKVFVTALWYDYPVAFVTAGLLSLAGSYLTAYIGWFVIFLAPIGGGIIAEAVRLVTRRRRSPRLYQAAMAGVALGVAPAVLLYLIAMLFLSTGVGSILAIVWQIVYGFLAGSSAYYRLRGISIK